MPDLLSSLGASPTKASGHAGVRLSDAATPFVGQDFALVLQDLTFLRILFLELWGRVDPQVSLGTKGGELVKVFLRPHIKRVVMALSAFDAES